MMSEEHNQTQEFELKREDLYNYLSSQHMIAFLDILGSADAIIMTNFPSFPLYMNFLELQKHYANNLESNYTFPI